ncbi:MAG: hypothetical protein EP306_13230 [Burkholderiales bacterium]|nr:MAG: hypothetical protein EP306_13230 [Burkholderiales bacterium]
MPQGRLQGRQQFADLVRQAIEAAAAHAWSPLVLCDADFEDWPLGERAVVRALQDWAAQGRRIRFLARDYRKLREQQPRLVQWRTQWSHLVEAQVWAAAGEGELPSALWTPAWCLERVDPARGVMTASAEPARLLALRERIESAWQRGRAGFPATVLGL